MSDNRDRHLVMRGTCIVVASCAVGEGRRASYRQCVSDPGSSTIDKLIQWSLWRCAVAPCCRTIYLAHMICDFVERGIICQWVLWQADLGSELLRRHPLSMAQGGTTFWTSNGEDRRKQQRRSVIAVRIFQHNRFFVKLFETSDIHTVKICRRYFDCDPPRTLLKKKIRNCC